MERPSADHHYDFRKMKRGQEAKREAERKAKSKNAAEVWYNSRHENDMAHWRQTACGRMAELNNRKDKVEASSRQKAVCKQADGIVTSSSRQLTGLTPAAPSRSRTVANVLSRIS